MNPEHLMLNRPSLSASIIPNYLHNVDSASSLTNQAFSHFKSGIKKYKRERLASFSND